MNTKAPITVEQFAQMHTADTEDFELVEGELRRLSSGTYRHNRIRDLIGYLLWNYFTQNPIGEAVADCDCQIAPDEVRRPDLSIFFNEHLRQIDPDGIPAPLAPDIAIEVVSPSESAVDLRRRVRDYLRGGSQEVWVVDRSNGEVLVHTSAGIRVLRETDVLESPSLPGFRLKAADLFVSA
jgi:Uma2 family endonuclease